MREGEECVSVIVEHMHAAHSIIIANANALFGDRQQSEIVFRSRGSHPSLRYSKGFRSRGHIPPLRYSKGKGGSRCECVRGVARHRQAAHTDEKSHAHGWEFRQVSSIPGSRAACPPFGK